MITVRDLSKSFDDQLVLDGVNMVIPKGSIYGLIGRNGSGKTTIIKHLVGVLQSDTGTLMYDDKEIFENKEVKSHIAFMPDMIFFPPGATLKYMKDMYASYYDTFNEERYTKLVKVFQLDERKNLRRLSKGMRKQAMFCLLMSVEPDFLILDEPLDGLDPVARKLFNEAIIDDVAEREMSVLISSHNLRELENICDMIGILSEGKIIKECELDDLKQDINKVQVAIKPEYDADELYKKLNVMHIDSLGSVDMVIVRNNREDIESVLGDASLILDIIPLSLEELFIYENGGVSYDINELL